MDRTILNLEDLASRLRGCIELIFLIGANADKAVISSGVMGCVSELLNGIYSDLTSEINSVKDQETATNSVPG